MAKGTVIKETGTYGKKEQKKSGAKLSKELQEDLEIAILRLFANSAYCDVELIAESDSVLTHSCILQARVARFYNFLLSQCQVLPKNGLSCFVVYNVSFVKLRHFVENIYKDVDISSIEECMLEHLVKVNKNLTDWNKNIHILEPRWNTSNSSRIALTPETDLFYTPKCSPSEIQKPFAQSYSDSPINRKGNDITCYYKIVSVDDVHIDDKTCCIAEKPKDGVYFDGSQNLEKELAEQDELYHSFQSVFAKLNKSKHSCGTGSLNRKDSPKLRKKIDSNLFLSDDCKKSRGKFPFCRPNSAPRAEPTFVNVGRNKSGVRNDRVDPPSPRRLFEDNMSVAVFSESGKSFCRSEMNATVTEATDTVTTTNSSSKSNGSRGEEAEGGTASPVKANSDLKIYEEPHSGDVTFSKKSTDSVTSSSSSDAVTWNANVDMKNGCNGDNNNKSASLLDVDGFKEVKSDLEYDAEEGENGNCRDTLNEEEIARLDAMERNIKECETFLDRERQVFYYFDNPPAMKLNENNVRTNTNRGESVSESIDKVILKNNLTFNEFNNSVEIKNNNNIKNMNSTTGDVYLCEKELRASDNTNYTANDAGGIEKLDDTSALNSDIMCKNLMNNDLSNGDCANLPTDNSLNCYVSGESFAENHLNSLTQLESGVFHVSAGERSHAKTPPCSPRHMYEPPADEEPDTKKKSDLVYPDVKYHYQNQRSIIPAVNNYFIDASSLLDEDEISSPPLSFLTFKTADREGGNVKSDEKEENLSKSCVDGSCAQEQNEVLKRSDSERILQIREEERRQGDLIFKSSIPHFSRHEVEKTEEAMERMVTIDVDCAEETCNDGTELPDLSTVSRGEVTQTGCADLSSNSEMCPSKLYNSHPLPCSDELVSREQSLDEEKDTSKGEFEKKLTIETHPIVSGGALPEDFSNPPSHVSSPHLRRRNESAPIVSGGMEYVEPEKKTEKRPSGSQGAAWIVSFNDDRPRMRKESATTASESDAGSMEFHYYSDRECATETRGDSGKFNPRNFVNAKDDDEDGGSSSQRCKNSIEKSASLGYFIEFNKEGESVATSEDQESRNSKKAAKKNIFSMFIDMKGESKLSDPETRMSREKESDESIKKPFYMFIESDSPAVRRKTNQQSVQRKLPKPRDGDSKESPSANRSKSPDFRRRTIAGMIDSKEVKSPFSDKNKEGSLHSSFQPEVTEDDKQTERKQSKPMQQVRYSKLPLPLCKSSSLSAVADSKLVVWSEKKEQKCHPGESWLRTTDIQVRYRGRNDGDDEETKPSKDSNLVGNREAPGAHRKRENKKSAEVRNGGFHLRVVEEGKSPFKSPEERDSGIMVTEESDDSFVKLSDMDNFKNPYLESGKKKTNSTVMSQSIPDSGWGLEGRSSAVRVIDCEPVMSKSTGPGMDKSNAAPFASDANVTRSLSRLFPNLNFFGSGWRSGSSKQDTDRSDSQVSELSEMSSMQSSIEPSGQDTSTSEADVSPHNGTSRLGQDLLRMFLEEISPDVIVEVAGRRIKAHKCILSSRCQFFAALLSGGWVESAGNVISLQGFSYNSVHFALCHIYSGESRIPDSLNITELATLADKLCLEGLMEVISHTLKVKYCHSFHPPCDDCHVGVLDCLPVAAAYGLEDLYRECLRWITKHFVRVWPSKTFASLPKVLRDKCYRHHVVHMTVENVLGTILNIDTIRGSLPNVRWAETISRMVTNLHDAAVKYIADHFSSILTSDNFLALGKEASWSVARLEDSLMMATKRLPPEQACWSHARLHRILTVVHGSDQPSEMDWNQNFIDLLQCIAGHVENSLIKQAPRAAKSKAWKQLEPELRSKIQERACLVLPDEISQSPRPKRTTSLKRETRQVNASSIARTNPKHSEIRHVILSMSHQPNSFTSSGRLQHPDQRSGTREPTRFNKPAATAVSKKPDISSVKKSVPGAPELKRVTPSRFMDVKSRYLEPKSPQKAISDKVTNASTNVRRTARPLSSSDSSRNCSPLNANPTGRFANARHHRDSVVSTESATSQDGKKDKNTSSTRSDTPSSKTLSQLAADENMSTDSLFTDSLYSEKDATMTARKSDSSRPKGKENGRKITPKALSNAETPKLIGSTSATRNSTTEKATLRSNPTRTLATSASDTKVTPARRFPVSARMTTNQRASPGVSSLASPRTGTNRNALLKSATRYDDNVANGNAVKKIASTDVDAENNKNTIKDDKRPGAVSRSGTFLKDEPTILKKPQGENSENSF